MYFVWGIKAQKPIKILKLNVWVENQDYIPKNEIYLCQYSNGIGVKTKFEDKLRAVPLFHHLGKTMGSLKLEKSLQEVLERLFDNPCIGCHTGAEIPGALQNKILIFQRENTLVSNITALRSYLSDASPWAWKIAFENKVTDIGNTVATTKE
ncbi:hypothetical protein IF1G_11108 [Cordyceps javanica]|uniref:Uncharacterized protein n=1 Tax=Cordyceps javanica TaxID=43265 RepID=A0A545UL79_9HYPO|nr:hypothetical protein IF1G_11108 [Cordyceps javanica]